MKKEQKRRYFLRTLRKNDLAQSLLVRFYRCCTVSIITHCFCVGFTSLTAAGRKVLQRLGTPAAACCKPTTDPSLPGHCLFARTNRCSNSFLSHKCTESLLQLHCCCVNCCCCFCNDRYSIHWYNMYCIYSQRFNNLKKYVREISQHSFKMFEMSASLGRNQLLLCCFLVRKIKLFASKACLIGNVPQRQPWSGVLHQEPACQSNIFDAYCFVLVLKSCLNSLTDWLLSENLAQNLGQICSCQTKHYSDFPAVHQLPNQDILCFNVEKAKINGPWLPSPTFCGPVLLQNFLHHISYATPLRSMEGNLNIKPDSDILDIRRIQTLCQHLQNVLPLSTWQCPHYKLLKIQGEIIFLLCCGGL